MAALVTLEEVNDRLRLDLFGDGNSPEGFTGDERTSDVEAAIDQSQAAVLGYLKVDADKWTISDVPPEVVAAIILGVRGLLDGEDALLAGLYDNDRTNPIVGLLQRRRDPALA